MGSPVFSEITPFEAEFIKQAEACGLTAEVCIFVDYYQDKGQTKEHLRAKPEILAFVKNLASQNVNQAPRGRHQPTKEPTMINPKCHNTGCNYPEGECTGACCCNGDCDQGRACPRREMPVQFAGDEPEPADGLLFWLALANVALAALAGTGLLYIFQLVRGAI